jgi:hypothetical protein
LTDEEGAWQIVALDAFFLVIWFISPMPPTLAIWIFWWIITVPLFIGTYWAILVFMRKDDEDEGSAGAF